MVDIWWPAPDDAFGVAFRTALSEAADDARANLDEFASVLSGNPASADAVLRGYASAGQPYGPGVDAAARWYAERAVSLCLTRFAGHHETHHENMRVVSDILRRAA